MSSLTIDELKKALTNKGIALPNGKVKKEDYVKLYEEHIAANLIKDAHSSDEESQGSRKVTSTNAFNDSQNIPADISFIDGLSDAELFEKLKNFGCNVGPILPNTRGVYIKKLLKFLNGGRSVIEGNGFDLASLSDQELEPPRPAEQHSRRISYNDSLTASTGKRESSVTLDERPVSRVHYIEKVPRLRVSGRIEKLYDVAGGEKIDEYVGRWSPNVSRFTTPSATKKDNPYPKKSIYIYLSVLLIIVLILATGCYQWAVNDPYQQIEEDVENEVKKFAPVNTEH